LTYGEVDVIGREKSFDKKNNLTGKSLSLLIAREPVALNN